MQYPILFITHIIVIMSMRNWYTKNMKENRVHDVKINYTNTSFVNICRLHWPKILQSINMDQKKII